MNRSILRQLAVGLMAGLVMLLTGCSGGGGSDDAAPSTSSVTITGVVTAPAGQVAKLQNKSFIYAVVEQLFPTAEAAVTGVSIVPNTTVTRGTMS